MMDLDFTKNLKPIYDLCRCDVVGYGMLAYLDCHINLFYLISQIDPNFLKLTLTSVCCVWSRLLLLSINSKKLLECSSYDV